MDKIVFGVSKVRRWKSLKKWCKGEWKKGKVAYSLDSKALYSIGSTRVDLSGSSLL